MSWMRLGVGMGAALLALTALCPISYANEAEAAGQGVSIGVSVEPLSGDVQAGGRTGLLVTGVTRGGPAELAGIEIGDVLLVVGTVALRNPLDLARAEGRIEPGQPVSVAVSRNGGRIIKVVSLVVPAPPREDPNGLGEDVAVTGRLVSETDIDAGPGGFVQVSPPSEGAAGSRLARLGLRCEELNSDLAAALRTPPGPGVVVLRVPDGSPIALAGIRAGDVIRRVGAQDIWGVEHLDHTLEGVSGSIAMLIRRQGAERRVEVTLAGPPSSDLRQSNDSLQALDEPVNAERDRELLELRRELGMIRREVVRLREEVEDLRRNLGSL